MPVKTSYVPGEPIWADLTSPDVEASRAFYGELFGWQAPPGNEEFGGYTSFLLGQHQVAGLMPRMSPEQPPAWSCYVCSDDAEKTTALVEQAGGTTVAPPMAVGDLGTMAVYADDRGAFFGIWQAQQHVGAELVDDEGTLTWIELSTRDVEDAKGFYGQVFGWQASESPDYIELQLTGRSVAGLMQTPAQVPAAVPPYWMPYFAAVDPGAKAEQAATLGGTVVVPATAFPGGTFAVVRDPHGAVFGLLEMAA